SGTMQCACTSTVLTRLPLMTTSRRPCAWLEPPPAPASGPALISQPTKARRGPVCMASLIGMSVPLVLMTVVTWCEFCQKSQHPPARLHHSICKHARSITVAVWQVLKTPTCACLSVHSSSGSSDAYYRGGVGKRVQDFNREEIQRRSCRLLLHMTPG